MQNACLCHVLILIVLLALPALSTAQNQEVEDFKLFNEWTVWSNGAGMLTSFLNKEAFHCLDKRDSTIRSLRTQADWKSRQENVKKALLAHIGPFPEKTPLNPKINGTLRKPNFHVEKIVFESTPGHYVTGGLFIPDGAIGKRPAILYLSGHTELAYKSDSYQTVILNLVKKGFIVFAIDPVGQGERLQYFDQKKGASVIGGPTLEHTYAGLQCFLTGTSINKYFIWDGIRAIDYLVSRPEVDPARIGITGRSGGGTQTVYIAAFDERILASVPENYVTSHRRLLESRGPQDAEQNFYHWLSDGTALEDLLVMRIPKPTLLVTTTRDIFSIQGVREAYRELLRGYSVFGKEEDFLMVEDHAAHASTLKNREAMYRFFQKYLSLPGNPNDEEIEILSIEELMVTKTGQISTALGGETVYSLNNKESENLFNMISASRQNDRNHLDAVKKKSMELSGYRAPKKEADVLYRGSYQREGYTVGMYALEGEGDYVIPLLLALPDGGGNHPVVIYIHPEGKEEGISAGGNIERLVKQGYMVAAPDLLGMGETKPNARFAAVASFSAIIIGRSIVGIQAGDIVRVVDFIKGLPNVVAGQISAVAFGEQCPSLLHAAVFEPSIGGIALVEAPVSYYNINQTKLYGYSNSFSWGVAGALTGYDLPDLAACISPRKLVYIGLQDGQKKPASSDLINGQMAFPRSVYAQNNAGNFKIVSVSDEPIKLLLEWLEE